MGGIRNNSWRYVRTAQTACFKSHEGDLPRKITAERRFFFRPFFNKKRKHKKEQGAAHLSLRFKSWVYAWHLHFISLKQITFFWLYGSECFGGAATVCWLCVPIRRPQVPSLFNKTPFRLQEMWVAEERFHIALFSFSLNAVYRELLKPHSISIRAC